MREKRRATHGVDRVFRALHDDLPEKDIAFFGELDLSAWHGVVGHLAQFLQGALVVDSCAGVEVGIAYGDNSLVGHGDCNVIFKGEEKAARQARERRIKVFQFWAVTDAGFTLGLDCGAFHLSPTSSPSFVTLAFAFHVPLVVHPCQHAGTTMV
jgi:hypothetical protein